ncbi:peptidase M24, structural domain-containing protein [Phycomyces nitens]|nr:peptidase M24, structural domain-containing protein [Phycomyces nitens]
MSPYPLTLTRPPMVTTRQHCLRVRTLMETDQKQRAIIYHRGQVAAVRNDTDIELDFRQESHFYYLTGVDEPGFHVVVDLETNKVYLVPPTIPENDIVWNGSPDSPDELLQKYDADEIVSEDDLPALLTNLDPTTIHILDTTDKQALYSAGITDKQLSTTYLRDALNEARLKKFPWEIETIRLAVYGSSQAHTALMQHTRPGLPESHLEGLFRWICSRNGMSRQAYIPIIASGPRSTTLHYTRNNQIIPSGPHTLVLVDAGGERGCYGSDVTRTFPATGVFSAEAKTIYNIVLKMQESVLSRLRPGAMWSDLERHVIQVLCKELISIGILVGEMDQLLDMGIPHAFFIHGLGHSVGLDVHDVEGQLPDLHLKRVDSGGYLTNFLKGRPLEANMIVTVEPGLYFNDTMLDTWTQYPGYEPFFDLDVIRRYRVVGGVRIEDTVLITKDGHENLTNAPKTVREIEDIMAGRQLSDLALADIL